MGEGFDFPSEPKGIARAHRSNLQTKKGHAYSLPGIICRAPKRFGSFCHHQIGNPYTACPGGNMDSETLSHLVQDIEFRVAMKKAARSDQPLPPKVLRWLTRNEEFQTVVQKVINSMKLERRGQ